MSSSVATPSSKSIGLYLQIAGGAAFLAGVALSLEHYAVGICLIAGAAAYYVGGKIKSA